MLLSDIICKGAYGIVFQKCCPSNKFNELLRLRAIACNSPSLIERILPIAIHIHVQ